MKIQELAIIFVIIILPISLLLSEYTQFQIQTLKTQTEYDSKLTAATYDAIKAFQLNSTNSTESGLANSEMRDLTASVNTFRNSIMSTFRLNGYTEEELNSYIPALVYTLYDGFYMYSPYENTNHRYEIKVEDDEEQIDHITGEVLEYETDAAGNKIAKDGNGEKLYGIKPYISYSCRYVKGSTDVVITYTLDNHITVQGNMVNNMGNTVYVNRSGYLVDGITIEDQGDDEPSNDIVKYNDVEIVTEQLKEYLPLANAKGENLEAYQYAKISGVKYYLIDDYYETEDVDGNVIYKDCIVYLFNGTPLIQAKEGEDSFDAYESIIENNNHAIQYYKDAYYFTDWLKNSELANLKYSDAYDEVIDNEGQTLIKQVWSNNETLIFKDTTKKIENQLSNFNQHRLAVIRHKIETNLAIAIANYNEYSGVTNVFQMPQLKETEWDYITHNISMISFLQGLPIGGKIYNGYSLVTNSESDKVVLEDNIYILSEDDDERKKYCRIGDNDITSTGSATITSGNYAGETDGTISAGRMNLDFERSKVIVDGEMKYYYPLKDYNASYNSIVMQNDVTTYDDIYAYMESQKTSNPAFVQAFYIAIARERYGMYNSYMNASLGKNVGSGAEMYTITYDANGGSNPPSQQSVPLSDTVNIADHEPTRTGYTFLGWSLNENDTVQDERYDPGDLYQERTSIVLYAVWTVNEYVIEFDANADEVTNMPDNISGSFNTTIKLPSKVPERDGYSFDGWALNSNAEEGDYVPDGDFTISLAENYKLYAVWKIKTYELKYFAAGEHKYTQYWTVRRR